MSEPAELCDECTQEMRKLSVMAGAFGLAIGVVVALVATKVVHRG